DESVSERQPYPFLITNDSPLGLIDLTPYASASLALISAATSTCVFLIFNYITGSTRAVVSLNCSIDRHLMYHLFPPVFTTYRTLNYDTDPDDILSHPKMTPSN